MRRGAVVLALTLAAVAPAGARAQETPDTAGATAAGDTLFPKAPLTPGGAFIRSLVVPGWAQAELGAEARGAFYFFAEAFSIFMIARTDIRLDHAERTLPNDHSVVTSRRQQKEDWIALAVFWAFFAAADGWISVHLYGFDERTGLSPDEIAVGVGWKIPFGP
jgi:hypothetical protein